jgi:hypothetical protein
MQASLAATGLGIEPGCADTLDKLVNKGATRLDEQQGDLNQAIANLKRLIDTMAKEARTRGAATMHGWSLSNALGRLCPLFPFC